MEMQLVMPNELIFFHFSQSHEDQADCNSGEKLHISSVFSFLCYFLKEKVCVAEN